jgi:hypothetical protein
MSRLLSIFRSTVYCQAMPERPVLLRTVPGGQPEQPPICHYIEVFSNNNNHLSYLRKFRRRLLGLRPKPLPVSIGVKGDMLSSLIRGSDMPSASSASSLMLPSMIFSTSGKYHGFASTTSSLLRGRPKLAHRQVSAQEGDGVLLTRCHEVCHPSLADDREPPCFAQTR